MTATRLGNRLSTFALLLLAMQWAAVPAQAQIPVTTCGTVISAPGSYFLANDLLNCPVDGVDIRSGDVLLMLNSHQITGTHALISRGIYAAPSSQGVSIVGPGTVAQFATGVNFEGVRGGAYIVLVTAQANNSVGFLIAGSTDVTLNGNTALNNQEGFLFLNVFGGQISENVANTNKAIGMRIIGSNNQIVLNTANNNGAYGITVDDFINSHDNRIVGNTALGNSTFDLAERFSLACRSTWTSNVFKTANLPCIH